MAVTVLVGMPICVEMIMVVMLMVVVMVAMASKAVLIMWMQGLVVMELIALIMCVTVFVGTSQKD